MSENQNMEKKVATTALTVSLVLASILISISSTGLAIDENASKQVDVNVSIASEVAVDVEPKTLSYTGASVGQQYNVTDRSYRGITIENTGSEYIDKLWVNASMPENRPFASGRPSAYNAGNFLQILPNTSSKGISGADVSQYYYVNRREFRIPESSVPSYIVAPEDQITLPNAANPVSASQNGEVHVGRFRRGNEAIWFIIATSESSSGAVADDCDGNNGNAMIRIGNTPATPNQLGTVDFTDDGPDNAPADWSEYQIDSLSNSANYGIANTTVVLPFQDGALRYDVLTSCNGTKMNTVRTRFAVDVMDTQDLTISGHRSEFILDAGDTAQNMLLPGATLPLKTAVEVPTGVAAGDVTQGTLTVFATANTTATVN